MDAERIVVAPPGPSLCVESHCHPDPVVRSDRIGLVVSTIEPRKNAGFLLDWFHNSDFLPPDIELWWVGTLGWAMSQSELERHGPSPQRAPGEVSGKCERCRALSPLPDGGLVDLPVAVRGIRLPDPRLAAAWHARPGELHQLHV